jgi:putative toxin-antitoxin system antitoxin component (TIGR02293 family)
MNAELEFIGKFGGNVEGQDVWDMAVRVFESQDNAEEWMNSEIPSLGGKKPVELMMSKEGREMVKDALERILTGDYS